MESCCYQLGSDICCLKNKLDHNHKMLHHLHCMVHCLSGAIADIAKKLMTPEETAALIAKINLAKAGVDAAIAGPPVPPAP